MVLCIKLSIADHLVVSVILCIKLSIADHLVVSVLLAKQNRKRILSDGDVDMLLVGIV